jgi:HD-like signal output (HDOD) protein
MDAGAAFCAGVLHDLGKLILVTLAPARWQRFATAAPTAGDSAEIAEFGAGHAEVGAWLGARWHFPVELLEAIREHHTPAPAIGRWGALVRLADGIAHRGGCPSPGPGAPAAADPALLSKLSIDSEAFATVENGFAFSLERVEAFAEAARSAP